MAFTKEQLKKLGIDITDDSVEDATALELIAKKQRDTEAELTKHKDLLSKRNSEIAEYKRKDEARLTEDEKTKLHYEELERKNAELEKQMTTEKRVNEYIALGYDADLAKKVVEAELEGKPTVEYRKQFITSQQEKIKAETLKNAPQPASGGNPQELKVEDLNKMGYEQLLVVAEKNPELYRQYCEAKKNK